jgi:type II secretory pathway pseudopilin PulG
MEAKSHAQRGQALVELVVSVPLFVFALLALLTVIAVAVQSERLQQALRYNGLIAQQFDPYQNYSLYELYENAGTTTIVYSTCVSPTDPNVPGGSGILGGSAPLPGTNSAPFWQPWSQPTGSCTSSGPTGFSAAGYGLYNDLLLQHDATTLTTSAWGPLKSLFTSAVSMTGSANFFESPGLPLVLSCYSSLNTMVQQALQPTSTTAPLITPLPLTGIAPTPITPFGSSANCL